MTLSTMILITSISIALSSHFLILYRLEHDDDYFESLHASFIYSIESSSKTTIVWCLLLMVASFILENDTSSTLKNQLPHILYSNRYWLLLVFSIGRTAKMIFIQNELTIFKRKEKNSLNPLEELQHLLQLTGKRKELADRKLNFLKSFSSIPILLLLINNLSSLQEDNPAMSIESLLLLNKANIYILLGILGYLFLAYNTFSKCQTHTRQELYLLKRIRRLSKRTTSSNPYTVESIDQ